MDRNMKEIVTLCKIKSKKYLQINNNLVPLQRQIEIPVLLEDLFLTLKQV